MTDDGYPPTLAAALAKLQTQLPRIAKSETAKVVSQKGSYSYTYAGLADISARVLPLLGAVGLSFTGRPTFDANGRYVLRCALMHASGESIDGDYLLPTSGTPQVLGSAMTYGRRYILCAMTGVAPDEDDDGAAAEAAAAAQPKTARRRDTQAGASKQAPASTRASRAPASRAAADAPPLPGGDDAPERITDAQMRKVQAIFGNAKVDREVRLAASSAILQRELTTARTSRRTRRRC
jgi:hypothetical protein